MSNLTNPAIPKDSTILVTGANGYIGSHVVDQLLALGYRVRGTVRASKPWLDELFSQRHGAGRFESVVIPAMEAEGAFDEAMEGVKGVVHVASDVSFSTDTGDVISKAVGGITNVLKAAAKHASVERLVLTSSSSAVYLPVPNKKHTVDENTWNEEAIRLAWSPDCPPDAKPFIVYAASKTEAEKAAWNWVKEKQPGFVLNTILPNYNTGAILHPEIHGSTMGMAAKLLEGDRFAMDTFPPQYNIDVIDNARLHVAALLDPSVDSERLFGFSHRFGWADVIGYFRKAMPNNSKIPDPPKDEAADLADVVGIKRALEVLEGAYGMKGWTPAEESWTEGIRRWM